MVVTSGQQYNVGEKPTVVLYTYINRHAGINIKTKTEGRMFLLVFLLFAHTQRMLRASRILMLNRVLALRKIDKKGSVVSRLPSLAEIKRE